MAQDNLELFKGAVFNGPGNQVIEVRTGKAVDLPPVLAPKKVVLNGTIGSVREFLGKRHLQDNTFSQTVNEGTGVIVQNKEKGTISYFNNPEDEKGTEVHGSLKLHPSFVAWRINGDAFSIKELLNLVRMNKRLFTNIWEYNVIVDALANFKANGTLEIEASKSNNGSYSGSVNKVFNAGFPETFELVLPIYIGEPDSSKITFTLSIVVDNRETRTDLNIECYDLEEKIENLNNTIFQRELKGFEETFVILSV